MMAGHSCPTCGRALPKPKVRTADPAVNLKDLTTAELYAYYKRTALIEDLRFLLRVRMSPDLRARIKQTLSAKPTAADTRLMFTLWRIERAAEERDETEELIQIAS